MWVCVCVGVFECIMAHHCSLSNASVAEFYLYSIDSVGAENLSSPKTVFIHQLFLFQGNEPVTV